MKNIILGAICLATITLSLPVIAAEKQLTVMEIGSFGPVDESPSDRKGDKEITGTLYISGMGGHFAKAVIKIDPSKSSPIILTKRLSKVDIGNRPTHPTRDARIDLSDPQTMFYSTYKFDEKIGAPHVGKINLSTDKIFDVAAPVPSQVTHTKTLYGSSGQTNDFYLPATWTHRGYIDVFRKSDLSREHTIFLEGTTADIQKPYKFLQVASSSDLTKLLVLRNEANKDHGKTNGNLHVYELDAKSIEDGQVRVLKKSVVKGNRESLAFGAAYSSKDDLIAIADADIMLLLNNKFEALDAEPMNNLDQIHDVVFTPNDKYAILALRVKVPHRNAKNPKNPQMGEFTMDGQLRLYDVEEKKLIGRATSVCQPCHDRKGIPEHSIIGEFDAVFD